MKHILITLSLLITTIALAQNPIQLSDFEFLDNTDWKGKLMYINYSDGKEVIIETELSIIIKNNKLVFDSRYPFEPKANDKSTIKISNDGKKFGKERVTTFNIDVPSNLLRLKTSSEGKDNNRKAIFIKIYDFNGDKATITKEVQYLDAPEPFVRNRYTYTKL